jgi:hypothetical protein
MEHRDPRDMTRDEVADEIRRLDALNNDKTDADYDRLDALLDHAIEQGWL